ncbi:MAG: DUF2184 domain-containing protein [Mariprofundaceae bacterium]|nr:DUF2184 domain-containing protein [Methylophaga sp.]MBL4759637.1 DUF2184 domain-containing protein [Mariprofundaceae bacterium]
MKIGNLYDLDSFKKFQDSSKQSGFKDAYSGSILARNLTAVDPQIFEKKYPELSFVNSGIAADNSGGYARIIQSLRKQELGGFSTAGDASGNKGKISMTGEESSLKVVERESHSIWTDSEVKEADLQNINLVSDYISAHNRIYLREVDQIGYLGVPDVPASTGLLNYAGFTSAAATGAVGGLTAQQMYDDIAGLITAQHNAVNNTPEYMAVKVDMPIYVLNTLTVTILNTANGASSVLSALKANFAGVEFRGTFRADDAGGVGVSHTVAYSTNSEAMKMRIPTALTVGEIIKQGSFDYRVDSKYRIGGLDVLENTAGYILTGL